MPTKEIRGLRTIDDVLTNPWNEEVALFGTDGPAHPLLEEDEEHHVMADKFLRNVVFKKVGETTMHDMTAYEYEFADEFWQNSTANPENANFNTEITGTVNLTKLRNGSPLIATF